MKKQIKKGFTLAEVLITLTILGVVAAIVIPTMLRNNGEVAERTKLKKAIVDYEKVVENMRINENYQSVEAMKADMNVEGCDKSRGYFKTKTVDSENGCIFQTSDGLWWNVKNIAQPIIAFEKENLTEAKANGDTNEAFYLTVTQGTAVQGYAFLVNEASGDANKILAFAKLVEEKNVPEEQPFTTIEAKGNEIRDLASEPCSNPNLIDNHKSCTNCGTCYIDDGNEEIAYYVNGEMVLNAGPSWYEYKGLQFNERGDEGTFCSGGEDRCAEYGYTNCFILEDWSETDRVCTQP